MIPEHSNENELCPDRMLIPASQALLWASLNNLLVLLLIRVEENLWHGSFYIWTSNAFTFAKIIIYKGY